MNPKNTASNSGNSSTSSDESVTITSPPKPRSATTNVATNQALDNATFLATTRQALWGMTQSVLETTSRRLRSSNTTTATTTNAATPSTGIAMVPGEEAFQNLLNVAEYEIHQDPYRGILSHQQSLETKTPITTPWHACEWGTLPPEPIQHDSDLANPQVMVRHVTNCACPSLKEWTRVQVLTKKTSQKKRKRAEPQRPLFQMGKRPEGDNFVCPCDYNPLCLATLGGIMNELIEERCQELNGAMVPNPETVPSTKQPPLKRAQKTKNKDEDVEMVLVQDPVTRSAKATTNVEVVDVDGVSSPPALVGNNRTRKDDASDNSDTFAFMEATSSKSATSTEPSKSWVTPLLKANEDVRQPNEASDVFLSSFPDQLGPLDITYSPLTNQSLQNIRKSVEVDISSLRKFIQRILEPDQTIKEEEMTMEWYLQVLKDWHEKLQFNNPVSQDKSPPDGHKMSLAMPPGIRNLGATCYLNTQLQCLAQNLTFLNGIFSWRMVDENHTMNSVMTNLQLLLAQMFLGGQCKVTTLDFSNALGLEHDEQQDPNEFARLLFDRMDESFQQCDNDGNLGKLLNKIFHGVTTYETICLTCGTSSERNEGFMDLNLPIVKPNKELKRKTGTIDEAFAIYAEKNVDTDVQFCLDQYTCAEILDGENQYFCNKCNGKRDAKRILKLTELPPVLNVQLSRYVFDRTKFIKKKVSDKVLLPTSLIVQSGSEATKKYLLCAVMKHQGNSAYSGHYLAEAMDWLTGNWFEFNDETVKVLPDGPSSSFDPEALGSETGRSNKSSKSRLVGSQDAYNMYYVDEDYLVKSARTAIQWRETYCKAGLQGDGVLQNVNNDRKESFSSLSEDCIADAQVADRLHRRKVGIRKYMLPNAQALVRTIPFENDSEIGAWVSTEFLKHYLQCRDDKKFEALLRSSDPILKQSVYMCEHGRLSPAMARSGKLLPIPLYEALVSLLRGERALLMRESNRCVIADYQIEDCRILPYGNLICKDCSESHRSLLCDKWDTLRTASDLYHALDNKKDDVDVVYDDGNESKIDDEMFVYAISKQTAVRFRRRFAEMMKLVAKIDGGGNLDNMPESNQSSIYEGLSAIDTTFIQIEQGVLATESTETIFNSNITCCHGKFNSATSWRHTRYVLPFVWKMVKKLFPDAIEHKRKRELRHGQNDMDYDCPFCRQEREFVEVFKRAIQTWAIQTRENIALKALLDKKRTLVRDHNASNFNTAANWCRLVHKADISTWREAIKTLSSLQRIAGSGIESIRSFVEDLAFPNCHKVILEFENEPIDKLVASLRSFICREHDMVVQNAILGDVAPFDRAEAPTLASYVLVVSKEEYDAYIESLARLLSILRSNVSEEVTSMMDPRTSLEEKTSFIKHVDQVISSHHPLLRNIHQGESSGRNTLKFIHDGSVKQFYISPHICDNQRCMKECAFLAVVGETDVDDDHIENISVDSVDANSKPRQRKSTPKTIGMGSADPIVVDSDAEGDSRATKFPLRVFELEPGATQDDALVALRNVSAITNDLEIKSERRRSTRKRNAKYPCGVLLREDSVQVSLDNNLAAVCLFLYESCGIQANYSKLFLVLTPEFEPTLVMESSPFDSDAAISLQELIMRLCDGRLNDKNFDHTKHTLLLYQRGVGEGAVQHEILIEALFQSANIDNGRSSGDGSARNDKGTSKSRTKNPRSERGFQGTLLQSGCHPPAPAPQGHDDDPPNDDNPDDNVIQGNREILAISDDEQGEESVMRSRGTVMIEDDDSAHGSASGRSSRQSSIRVPREEINNDKNKQRSENRMMLNVELDMGAPKSRSKLNGYEVPSLEKDVAMDDNDFDTTNKEDSENDDDRYSRNRKRVDQIDSERNKFSLKIFESLQALVQRPDPTKIWDAVLWALDQNPTMKDATAVLDAAFAKYLSNVEENNS